jgi:hypothetical protein
MPQEYVATTKINGIENLLGTVSTTALSPHDIKLPLQKPLKLSQAKVELLPGSDEKVAKAGLTTARNLLDRFVQQVPPGQEALVAAVLWHNRGMAACLKAFPQEVAQRLQSQQIQFSVLGLQHNTNELLNHPWQGETVPVRLTLETNPASPIANRLILQVGIPEGNQQTDQLTWRTLGALSKEAPQLPIGTTANATIMPQEAIVTTRHGSKLTVRNADSYDCAHESWERSDASLWLRTEGKATVAYVAIDGEWRSLGTLHKDSVAAVRQAEQRYRTRMIDSDFVFKGAQLTTAQVKSVTVTLDSSSIQYPEQWVTAASSNLSKSSKPSAV